MRLLDGHIQGGWLFESFEIGSTPLNSSPVSGEQFEAIARAELARAGVPVEDRFLPSHLDVEANGVILRFETDPEVRAEAILFAPNSQAPEPPAVIRDAERYWNRSIGWSVAAELGCKVLPGQTVVVLGEGYFALEQALLAAKEVSQVTIVCSNAELRDPAGLKERAIAAGIRIRTGVKVQRVISSEEEEAAGLLISRQGQEEVIPFGRLFDAGNRGCSWKFDHGSWLDAGDRLFPAGIANGLPDWDHAALWNDGIRAANAVVSGGISHVVAEPAD